MNKLLVICGPTGVGKTALAAKLAKKFNGELVSADSRQVYRGMDIGTGKDRPKGVKINLIDVVNPNEEFSVSQYYRLALKAVKEIWKAKKLPILVGGTGFYIKAITSGIETKDIPPNPQIRQKMDGWDYKKLFDYLGKVDSQKAAGMNISDRQNPRRLIRAIEIAAWLKENKPKKTKPLAADLLTIGLRTDLKNLYAQIDDRTVAMVKAGMKKEIRSLLNQGYNWGNSALSATIGYREWRLFFEKQDSLEEILAKWQFSEHAYARRQMTWFRKNKKIAWFDIESLNWQDRVEKRVYSWYHKLNAEKD